MGEGGDCLLGETLWEGFIMKTPRKKEDEVLRAGEARHRKWALGLGLTSPKSPQFAPKSAQMSQSNGWKVADMVIVFVIS